MATEILINDGGAPARILPYEASEAISAGEACTIDANGKTSEGYEVYCMCVRINYEWRVVYVSCDDFATGEQQ